MIHYLKKFFKKSNHLKTEAKLFFVLEPKSTERGNYLKFVLAIQNARNMSVAKFLSH